MRKNHTYLKVGRAAAQTLDVDTPLLGIQVKGFKGTLLTKQLDLINVLVAAIVPGTGIALGILVGQDRAQGVEDCAGGEVFGTRAALNLHTLPT